MQIDNIKKYKCVGCGRTFNERKPHKCVSGYTKRKLCWEVINQIETDELTRHKAEIARLQEENERLNHIVRRFRNVATILKGIDFDF